MSAERLDVQPATLPDLGEIFKHLPDIATKRLVLRPLSMQDARAVFTYAADPQVSRYTLWESPMRIAETQAYLASVLESYRRGEPDNWAITLSGTCIGTIGLYNLDANNRSAEVHYALAADQAGKGYMSEALTAVVSFAMKTLKLNRIGASCMLGNVASERVMQKAGMKFEGVRRQAAFKNGFFHDLKQYAIVDGDIP